MSLITERDARTILARDKFFSLRPKPLERWLWAQHLPSAAERVFWVHWSAGMQRGDWCSELSLRQVASECHVDTSTVTRSYQVLRRLGLIRREDPGRDASRPFQQAIAVTEVRIPRELLVELGRAPNRPRLAAAKSAAEPAGRATNPQHFEASHSRTSQKPAEQRLSRAETTALMLKLSEPERAAFFHASRDRRTQLSFDPQSQLSSEEQGQIIRLLASIAAEQSVVQASVPLKPPVASGLARARTLSPLEAAYVRKSILRVVPSQAAQGLFTQVLWSIEEGALRQFAPAMAVNIALKKIREGGWTKPNRMPPNWRRGTSAGALPETCSDA